MTEICLLSTSVSVQLFIPALLIYFLGLRESLPQCHTMLPSVEHSSHVVRGRYPYSSLLSPKDTLSADICKWLSIKELLWHFSECFFFLLGPHYSQQPATIQEKPCPLFFWHLPNISQWIAYIVMMITEWYHYMSGPSAEGELTELTRCLFFYMHNCHIPKAFPCWLGKSESVVSADDCAVA